MNQKGFLLTFAVFLLVMALLFFNSVVFENTISLEQRSEQVALREASQKYLDIERTLMDLDLSSQKKTLLERGLPFAYTGDSNSLSFVQNFPLLSTSLPIYFNSLNGYRIFFLRHSAEDLSPGFELDLNTIKDANWGGTENQAVFAVLPFCVQFSLSPRRLAVEKSAYSRCADSFDAARLRKIDLNILILDIREDFNSLQCFRNGFPEDCGSSSWQQSFNPTNTNTYYSVSFSTSGCPECTFSPQKVSLHHVPGNDYSIFLSCTNPPCDSEPFQLLLNQFFVATRDSNKNFQFKTSLEFDQNIQSFRSLDINFTIRVPKYGIVRTSDIDQLES